MKYFIEAIRRFSDFRGTSTREEFWYFVLFYFIFLIIVVLADSFLDMNFGIEGFGVLTTLFYLLLLFPYLAVTVRRLHDIDKSGLWIFISFVPFIGSIWLIILLARKGE